MARNVTKGLWKIVLEQTVVTACRLEIFNVGFLLFRFQIPHECACEGWSAQFQGPQRTVTPDLSAWVFLKELLRKLRCQCGQPSSQCLNEHCKQDQMGIRLNNARLPAIWGISLITSHCSTIVWSVTLFVSSCVAVNISPAVSHPLTPLKPQKSVSDFLWCKMHWVLTF